MRATLNSEAILHWGAARRLAAALLALTVLWSLVWWALA